MQYTMQTNVWLYRGNGRWHFVTIGREVADEIKKEYIWPRRGFGAVPVKAAIGSTQWKTSIFPDKRGTYLLPLKKEVRNTEKIVEGDMVTVEIEVIS
jgi:hypothetical protein